MTRSDSVGLRRSDRGTRRRRGGSVVPSARLCWRGERGKGGMAARSWGGCGAALVDMKGAEKPMVAGHGHDDGALCADGDAERTARRQGQVSGRRGVGCARPERQAHAGGVTGAGHGRSWLASPYRRVRGRRMHTGMAQGAARAWPGGRRQTAGGPGLPAKGGDGLSFDRRLKIVRLTAMGRSAGPIGPINPDRLFPIGWLKAMVQLGGAVQTGWLESNRAQGQARVSQTVKLIFGN